MFVLAGRARPAVARLVLALAGGVTFTRSGKERDGSAVYVGAEPGRRIATIYRLQHGSGGVSGGQSCLFRDVR